MLDICFQLVVIINDSKMSILVYKYLYIHLIISFQQVLEKELWVKMYKFLKTFDRYCQINIELNTTWKKKHVENVLLKYYNPAVEKLIILMYLFNFCSNKFHWFFFYYLPS